MTDSVVKKWYQLFKESMETGGWPAVMTDNLAVMVNTKMQENH